MNEVILNDNVNRMNKTMEKLTNLIDSLYWATQEQESSKTPNKMRPVTLNLVAATTAPVLALQLMPRNPSRYDVSIYNIGPGDLLYSNLWFDPSSILQQFSDPTHPNAFLPAPNQAVQIGLLPSGASTTINTAEAIWGWNNGTNALLTMYETIFAKPGSVKSSTFPVPGIDGALGAGYHTVADVDGNPTLIKGLH